MNSRCGTGGQILPPSVTEVLQYFLPEEGMIGTLCVQQESQQGVWSWRVLINQVSLCGAGFYNSEPENSSALQGNVTSGEDYSIVVKRLGHKSCFASLLI